MELAYSYQRFSNPAQESGDSLARQERGLQAWLKETGIPLDTSLTLVDKGIPSFKGQNAGPQYALGRFLEAINVGRVKRGSWLVVENMDRIARTGEVASMHLLTGILVAGINIQQLEPRLTLTEASGLMPLFQAGMEFSRGHGESKTKSYRVGGSWETKKKNAATKKVTSVIPGWIVWKEGEKPELHPERKLVVQRMFRMASEGHGIVAIAKKLNSEKVPNWNARSKTKGWAQSGIYHVLRSRTTIGEYQPHTGTAKTKRKKFGEPIKGYYPAVVTEDLFNLVQGGIARRKISGGGRKSVHVNIFSGLLVDARDNGAIHAERSNNKPSVYTGRNGKLGLGPWSCFPLEGFDRCILAELKEVKLQPKGEEEDKLGVLAGRYGIVDARLTKLKGLLKGSDEPEPILEAMRELSVERQDLLDKMEEERQKRANPAAEALGNMQALITSGEDRQRLAWAIKQVVKEVRCLFVGGRGENRVAVVEIRFHADEHMVRRYNIYYTPARGGRWGNKTPEKFECSSTLSEMPWYMTSFDDESNIGIQTPAKAAEYEEYILISMGKK